MPNIEYEASNREGSPTLIMGSSLGTDRSMWSEQVAMLPRSWNVVTFDLRGHGASPLSEKTPSIADFADDVVAIADELGVQRFAYCGLSIGGVIGQTLAVRHPDRLSSLILASTGLTILSEQALVERSQRVLAEGTGWIAEASAPRWFTQAFLEENPEIVRVKMEHLHSMDPRAYSDACLALAGFDGHQGASAIAAPTLVIAGQDDHATPPSGSAELAEAIRGAELQLLPDSSHLCSVEQPVLFTKLVREHVETHA